MGWEHGRKHAKGHAGEHACQIETRGQKRPPILPPGTEHAHPDQARECQRWEDAPPGMARELLPYVRLDRKAQRGDHQRESYQTPPELGAQRACAFL